MGSSREVIAIEDLKPAPYNPRTISPPALKALKKSLAKFGDISGIVWNQRTGHLVAGHQRLAALWAEHGEQLQIIDGALVTPTGEVFKIRVVDWDEKTEQAANVSANNPHISGEFTDDLQSVLAGLRDDFEDFAELNLEKLLAPIFSGMEDNEKILSDGLDKWGVEKGQIWQCGRHRIMCGDSTDKKTVERLLDGVTPFLMVTDPPYGFNYDPKWRNKAGINNNQKKLGLVTNDSISDWTAAWELFPGSVAYVWHAGINASVVQASLLSCGFKILSQIIWAKDRFALSRSHYHWRHEPCWYASRGTAKFCGGRKQNTLWDIPSREDSGTGHGTQKPLECMARPIRNHGNKDDVVYDPFLGSGTTLIASEKLGRICYGCEIEPQYVAIILERFLLNSGETPILVGQIIQ